MRKQSTFILASCLAISFITGCSSTSDVIEAPPAQGTSPETTAAKEPAQPQAPTTIELSSTFYFDVDDTSVRPEALQELKAHAERMKTNSQIITIEGHADERGSLTYNQDLGQRRADAVRDVLVSMGVSSSKIETVSYGETSPIAQDSNELAWQKNRRVELK